MRVYKKRLGDIVNFKRGYDLPSYLRKDGNYPIISSSGVSGFHSEFKVEGEGVVTGRYGTLGEMYYVNGRYWPHNTALYATDFKGNYPKYVYYLLKSLNSFKTSDKSTVPGINRNDLHEILVPYTEPEFQEDLTKVLSALDAKIELNNRINAELEAMAKMLYEYWFLQFDFPDANGKPYKSSGGKMVYNAVSKREIPEGWGVSTVADWIKADKTGDWGKEISEGNYTKKVYCIRGADLNDLNGAGICTPPVRYILEKNSHKILEAGDLIVEISGGSPTQSTGRMAYLTEETLSRFDAPIICSNFCKAITLKEKEDLYAFAMLWQMLYNNGIFFGFEGKTSGIKNFLFESFTTSYSSAIPDKSVIKKFYNFMLPIQAKKQKTLKENQKLTELRDWLLPMLMNGQVSVAEAEETLAMAAEPEVAYGKQN